LYTTDIDCVTAMGTVTFTREMLNDFYWATKVERQSRATKIGRVTWKVAQHLSRNIVQRQMSPVCHPIGKLQSLHN